MFAGCIVSSVDEDEEGEFSFDEDEPSVDFLIIRLPMIVVYQAPFTN